LGRGLTLSTPRRTTAEEALKEGVVLELELLRCADAAGGVDGDHGRRDTVNCRGVRQDVAGGRYLPNRRPDIRRSDGVPDPRLSSSGLKSAAGNEA
jgi:hypothetical protein